MNSLVRKSKKDYYNNAVKNGKDAKTLWENLRSLNNGEVTIKTNEPKLPNLLNVNGVDICNENEILDAFNKHFVEISHSISKIPFDEERFNHISNYFNNTHNGKGPFKIDFITPLEVKQYIENLDTRKATGLDGIGAKILKQCGDFIVLPITSIINNSIRTGIFPDKLKEAKVIPLYKRADRSDPNNYRPISILPTISKIFERHLSNQIKTYIMGFFHNFQSGFREKHSCQTSLTRITNDWLDAMDNGNYIGALFLDLRKAFDSVDHVILLHKLKLYNFSKNSIQLIESYLSNRYQIVQVGSKLSSKRLVTSGVPQGNTRVEYFMAKFMA